MSVEKLLATAIEAANAGASELDAHFGRGSLRVSMKAENDFVTEADHASEAAILSVIRSSYPEHEILAEESGAVGPNGRSGYQWIIDPLDGTRNFARGLPVFSISIACLFEGRNQVGVVLDPQRRELFSAVRGQGATRNGDRISVGSSVGLSGAFLATGYPFRHQAALEVYLDVFRELFLQASGIRRCGSAALDLAYTACGVYDGFFEFGLSPWDIAAGALLVEESGGRVTDLDGMDRYLLQGNVLAGNTDIQCQLQEVLSHHVGEASISRLLHGRDASEGERVFA